MTDQGEAIEKVANAKDKPDGEPNSVTVDQAAVQREIDKNAPDMPGPDPKTTDVSKQ
jgi:hypothetical protein